jgi:hypothetical protein
VAEDRFVLRCSAVCQCVGGDAATDDLDAVGGGTVSEEIAPCQEGAEQDVGELGIFGHESAELLGGDAVNATLFDDSGGEIDGLSGQEVELAEEASPSVSGDDLLGFVAAGWTQDLDLAGLDDDEVVGRVAGAEDDVVDPDLLRYAVDGKTSELPGG